MAAWNLMGMLIGEAWDNILYQTDVNLSFNTSLIFFETCFPLQYVPTKGKKINGLPST